MGIGLPKPSTIIETLFVCDGCFQGHKYRFKGGFALRRPKTDVIEFYDDFGNLLTTVSMTSPPAGQEPRMKRLRKDAC
jgi:hypothetical protein